MFRKRYLAPVCLNSVAVSSITRDKFLYKNKCPSSLIVCDIHEQGSGDWKLKITRYIYHYTYEQGSDLNSQNTTNQSATAHVVLSSISSCQRGRHHLGWKCLLTASLFFQVLWLGGLQVGLKSASIIQIDCQQSYTQGLLQCWLYEEFHWVRSRVSTTVEHL